MGKVAHYSRVPTHPGSPTIPLLDCWGGHPGSPTFAAFAEVGVDISRGFARLDLPTAAPVRAFSIPALSPKSSKRTGHPPHGNDWQFTSKAWATRPPPWPA